MNRTIRTPLTLVTGSLGSGKTTLLRYLLQCLHKKLAILMNEFGEIAIDSRILQGKNVQIAELGGGCVCCSLQGEFEAAVEEIIDTVDPELMVVETTGVAEPEAIIFDVQENVDGVRLDGVVTVADAEGLIIYPQLGMTTRLQIEQADTILLNKVDLVPDDQLGALENKIRKLNPQPPILHTERCRVDPDLLFGIGRTREIGPPKHVHQPEFESFSFESDASFEQVLFEQFADHLNRAVHRAKGFVRFETGTYLFNFVAGRWELEPFPEEGTQLVFIGRTIRSNRDEILSELKKCGC